MYSLWSMIFGSKETIKESLVETDEVTCYICGDRVPFHVTTELGKSKYRYCNQYCRKWKHDRWPQYDAVPDDIKDVCTHTITGDNRYLQHCYYCVECKEIMCTHCGDKCSKDGHTLNPYFGTVYCGCRHGGRRD